MDVVQRAVEAALTAQHETIESACERALQTGDRGVLVLRDPSGRVLAAEPDRSVPYGYVYEAEFNAEKIARALSH